jgi:hypothetical protein
MSPVRLRQTWKRKTPADDGWDRVEIVGFFEQAPRGIDEWVCRPPGALESVNVTAADLESVFMLEADAPLTAAPELGIDTRESWL